MDIGKRKRVIFVEPLKVPDELEQPVDDPVKEEPDRIRSGVRNPSKLAAFSRKNGNGQASTRPSLMAKRASSTRS